MRWIYLLFAVVFGGVGLGMLFGLILPDYRDANISKTGTLMVAEAFDASSNMEINGEPYYKIHFKYLNKDGSWSEGRTNSAYSYFQTEQILEKGEFLIRVSKSGRAVAADFKMTPGQGIFWIFVIAFGGVGVGMGTAFVIAMLGSANNTRIRLRGYDGEGYYIDSRVGITVNGSPLYKLVFGFKTFTGEEFIQKTPSKYWWWQIDALQNMGHFRVKYLGKKAIITEKITRNALKRQDGGRQISQGQTEGQQRRRCEWCGAVRKDNVCEFCGN